MLSRKETLDIEPFPMNNATDCISICSRYNVQTIHFTCHHQFNYSNLNSFILNPQSQTLPIVYAINIHLLPSKRHEAVSLIKSSIIPFLTLIPSSLHAIASDFNLNNTTTQYYSTWQVLLPVFHFKPEAVYSFTRRRCSAYYYVEWRILRKALPTYKALLCQRPWKRRK